MIDPNIKKEHLTPKAAKSAFWNMLSAVSVSFIRFLSTAVLARILMPEDFGIAAMAMVVSGIIHLFGKLGLGASLVQKQKKDDESLSTAFWATQLVSVALAAVCFIAAPFGGMFFKEPAVTYIVMSLSLNFIFSGLSAVHATLLYKDLRFKELFGIEISTTIVRIAVVLICALSGLRYWSIIIGILAERGVKTVVFFFVVKWRPKLYFDRSCFKELFHFGRNLYAESFIGYFNRNMDSVVTGRVLGASLLGYYNFANNIPHLILEFIAYKINDVLFPLYSKVKDDKERCARGYLKTVRLMSLTTFPLLAGLMFIAGDFVTVAYGGRWALSVMPMRILSLALFLACINVINKSLIMALGRPDINLKWTIIQSPLTIILIFLFSRWGIAGIASAKAVLGLLGIVLMVISTKLLKISFIKFLESLKPAIVNTLFMICFLWVINLIPGWDGMWIVYRFILNITLGAGLYVFCFWKYFNTEFQELRSVLIMTFEKE